MHVAPSVSPWPWSTFPRGVARKSWSGSATVEQLTHPVARDFNRARVLTPQVPACVSSAIAVGRIVL